MVSLGTIPGRNCTQTVISLLNQTCQPDRVYVALGGHRLVDSPAFKAPSALLRLENGTVGRIVLRVINASEDEQGPASKYLFTLRQEKQPNTRILVVTANPTPSPCPSPGSV